MECGNYVVKSSADRCERKEGAVPPMSPFMLPVVYFGAGVRTEVVVGVFWSYQSPLSLTPGKCAGTEQRPRGTKQAKRWKGRGGEARRKSRKYEKTRGLQDDKRKRAASTMSRIR